MQLPDPYSALYAEQLLSAIAVSTDTEYRLDVVKAIHDSAHDPAKGLLWRGVIRQACATGRIPSEIADYLIMRCSDGATNTLMADDERRLDEEIEQIDCECCSDDSDDAPPLSREAREEWNARVDAVEDRRRVRRAEVESALLHEWGEHEIAGWLETDTNADTDANTYCDREGLGAELMFGESFSTKPGVRPWVREPGSGPAQ